MRLSGLIPSAALALSSAWATPDVARAGTPPPVTASDRVMGRANAPVTVIEYASFVCSHCAAWHNDVMPAFKTRFIDTGRVRFVLRNLPTDPVNEASAAAAIARCAVPERFFDVADSLFAGQALVFMGASRSWFRNAVAASGRTSAEITACFRDPATDAALQADIRGATAAGATSTPSFFVNGRAVTDTSLDGLATAIAAAAPGR